ncbi:NAD(P)/FAD-dependent oxidoreductase [filamentous cyanobacterium LEGE 11480]|uniref:NADH:ubiquinone reductase (non-electrogenic) n=1 Tax=Romeriopsis navalis LEGE 11480 TaxID=2777977 RepID=A0A928VRR2_9CYAN|nr:NAD(P)/FAD-dependent oxidoreductase [Romeriopsis navalis]MBE9030959.1 NAD(P)/FAD-dependent oxidoreductase [Romeriopsis navalis LEGE 11480]
MTNAVEASVVNSVGDRHQVVIIGGGFGGLYAAKKLGDAPVDVTLIDKRNFHLFQPLLYQVATGSLAPADISSPLRAVLSKNKNVRVLMDEAKHIDTASQKVILSEQEIPYDTLIVATGVSHHYFGNDHWATVAPGLKTVEDALEVRRRILCAFEAAERETDQEKRQALLTFVVVGAGPTGVELAGAIADLAYKVMADEFRSIDTSEAQVILLEGLDRVLPPFKPELSAKAQEGLERLGVTVNTKTRVTNITETGVTYLAGDETIDLPAHTVLWAAGVKASPMGAILAEETGAELDRVGRVVVANDLSIPNQPDIFVVGDLANFAHQGDTPLPGTGAVAMQEGEYMAEAIARRARGEAVVPFRYVDLGSMAVIGQHEAVVDMGFIKFSGFFAWMAWLIAHIYFLIDNDRKLTVAIHWIWNYFTKDRGSRLITETAAAKSLQLEKEFATVVERKQAAKQEV